MTPKEKAIELIDKHRTIIRKADIYNNLESIDEIDLAKQCAFIIIDEMFEFMKMDDFESDTVYFANSKWVNYWQEVKKEIENI